MSFRPSPTLSWPAPERGIHRWRTWLPVPQFPDPVTLGEGGTPLIPARSLPGVFWKAEFTNPTGSHKDRPLALAASHAVATGARTFAVFSAGSTGLSAAAYGARAGLPVAVVMTAGVPAARVRPLAALGARLFEVEAEIDKGIAALGALAGQNGLYVASTTRAVNAVQAEAGRSISYEIVEALGRAPDQVVVPTGGGGTLAAVHAGFVQLLGAGLIDALPRLIAVVPEKYDTLARALAARTFDEASFLALPPPDGGPTILNKIAHDHPPDGVEALAALRDSGGAVLAIPEAEALAAVTELGAAEGLYLEPSSAIALPALRRLSAAGSLGPSSVTVVLACGSGFRETHVMLDHPAPAPTRLSLGDLGPALASIGAG
jgi:threonine synthase